MITTAKFQIERISDGAIAGFALATEVADYLVRKGMPFAEAHDVTGQAVRLAESRSVGLESLSLDDFSSVHPLFGADLLPLLSAEGAVRSRTSVMGTSPASVSAAISRVRGRLALQRSQLGKWRKQMDEVLGQ